MSKVLRAHLLKHKVTHAPKMVPINNSTLGTLKTWLTGGTLEPQGKKKVDKPFQKFGREFHKRVLEPKKKRCKLSKPEEHMLRNMIASLCAHPVFKKLLLESKKEILKFGKIDGVPVRGTFDIDKPTVSTIADPKTTAAPNYMAFIGSAIKYGYPRQAWLYMRIGKAKYFYFFGIQKQPPWKVLIMDVSRFPQEMAYYEQEAKFLLYFYKTYGLPFGVTIETK